MAEKIFKYFGSRRFLSFLLFEISFTLEFLTVNRFLIHGQPGDTLLFTRSSYPAAVLVDTGETAGSLAIPRR